MKMKIGILKTTLLLLLFHAIILLPLFSEAQSVQIPGFYGSVVTPPRNALPVPKYPNALPPGVTAFDTTTPNKLTIWQNQPKAIIDWSSFNIGADAWTHFDQQGNSSWVALNRIWDRNPSYIFGKLTADGKIYLINQNGILFGPGSMVNVNTLVASALNIKNEEFLNEIFRNKNRVLVFKMEDYQGTGLDGLAAVSNHGEINTTGGGSLFLMAPRVDNSGLINAPTGQVGLIAGTDVTLAQPDADDRSRSGYYVIINDDFNNPLSNDPSFGKAVNLSGGVLLSDGGIAGAYGNNVENWGIIRSTTAYKNKRGQVELRAANKVITGANSHISLPVDASLDPDTGKPITVDDTFDIQPVVDIRGLHEWSTLETIIDSTPVKRIEHWGVIEAPTGAVTMTASERVYLEHGSRIDVSGVVVELPAPVITDFKLNTVELRDAYGQKGGVLQGEKITTPVIAGSAIGDLSQLILTQERTALERSIGGARRTIVDQTTGVVTYNNSQAGSISLASYGDIIVKQGAVLDFSGGGIHYAGGFFDTTKLLLGTKIYDISSAPLYIQYEKIMGEYTKTHERFGIREKYTGLYYGGASPLKTYVNSYTVGGDAGNLNLSAPRMVLDGQLNGGVTGGVYQNTWTMQGSFSGDNAGSDYDLAMALSVRRGLENPRAGALKVNTEGAADQQGRESSISILPETAPRTDILPDTPLQTKVNTLSTHVLNTADLGKLDLTANLTISTRQGGTIRLQPGGFFSARARRIDHQGEIAVPGGSIRMIALQNDTSEKNSRGEDNPPENVVPLVEGIFLGSKSRLDASGERIDNSMAQIKGIASSGFDHIAAGTIAIKDQTDLGQGVFINTGAVLDVSGGYLVNNKGKVTGGNAGLLDIQGSNIALGGDLRGYALPDENGKILGGSVLLQSTDIHVAPNASGVVGSLVLPGNRFEDTGFTQIALSSFNDTTLDPNATIQTSLLRLNYPTAGLQAEISGTVQGASAIGDAIPGRPDLIRLKDSMAFMAGPSTFTAVAGKEFEGSVPGFTGNLKQVDTNSQARVLISPSAVVRTAPAVSGVTRIANDVLSNPSPVKTGITLRGPNVDVLGTLESLGGDIRLEATKDKLTITQDTRIFAQGYNRPDPASTPKGFAANYLPIAGGNVTLSAYADLILSEGALIDISGSDAVENRIRSTDGNVFTFREAGDPGSLSLSFGKDLTWSGRVKVKKSVTDIEGIRGGALTINKTQFGQTMSGLSIDGEDVRLYKNSGFDDITFKSFSSVLLNGTVDPATGKIGRKLTFDTPEIKGSGNDVTLGAPWIVMTNRRGPVSSSGGPPGGGLTLSGEWIDVIGSIQFSGFKDVTLKANRDLRLSEVLYDNNAKSGRLDATGNLIIDADRVYPVSFYTYAGGRNDIHPGVYSDFIVHADKKLTLQHSLDGGHTVGPIYSAGGSLVVEGQEGIEVKRGGFLAAPMGTIKLNAPGQRIHLADGSVISTAGAEGAAINYGLIIDSNLWMTDDKVSIQNATPVNKESLFQKSITLDGDTIIVMDGAKIDVSGSGSVFAYAFQPGIEGSNDPLARTGRYVVFKDNSFQMPGAAVYLKGGGGLSEGMHTLLPLDAKNPQNARYAFMPGAYVIEVQKTSSLPGHSSFSNDGYPLTVGYLAVSNTSIRGARPQVYSVRTAADVLTEGHYILPDPLTSGDAGDITVKGKTAIIAGDLLAAALSRDYQGGKTALSGTNVFVRALAVPLPAGMDFLTPVPDELRSNLNVAASSISGQGFKEINLGDQTVTDNVTIMERSVLESPVISLSAKRTITVETGAQLQAIVQTGFGEINLNSPTGSAVVKTGALLHASHGINLDVARQDFQGDLKVDQSALTLKGDKIFFVPDGYLQTDQGLYITDSLWRKYSAIDDITLVSGSDIQFRGDFIDDSEIALGNSLTLDAARILGLKDGGTSVTLKAKTFNLKNSGASSTATAQLNAGTFTVDADQINIGGGDILFGGFDTISLNSKSDLTLLGKGSLTTGNAELVIHADRVTSGTTIRSVAALTSTPITAANFVVYTGANYFNEQNSLNPANSITIDNNGGIPAQSSVPGGMLDFWGTSIDVGGLIQMDSGTIRLIATGTGSTDGVFMRDNARILARGTDSAPAGKVTLLTEHGRIELAANSLIDVSASSQGDAGAVVLNAPTGVVALEGDLLGIASKGIGGSFLLDTAGVTDFSGLSEKLAAAGFTESIDVRVRTGGLTVAAGTTVAARNIRLTADGGNLDVYGTVDASWSNGNGRIELYAKNDLTVGNGGLIKASGTAPGAKGGDVLLNALGGSINLNAGGGDVLGGVIDVIGNGGPGGTVYLRALRNGNDVNINLDRGRIIWPSAIYAEAVRVYSYSVAGGKSITATEIGTNDMTGYRGDTRSYMNNNTASDRLRARLDEQGLGNTLIFLPGIEVQNTLGDIILGTNWDFSERNGATYVWRYGSGNNVPGVLTLRAKGNLNISNNLVDHPTAMNALYVEGVSSSPPPANGGRPSPFPFPAPVGPDSWAYNLTAGADMAGANTLSVLPGTGNLTINNAKVVYTESAPIHFASGNDTVIGSGLNAGYMISSSMKYNLATYDGPILGYVSRDLAITGGSIQTATGDINIHAGRDLQLNSGSGLLGAIRTTGQTTATETKNGINPLAQYWTYDGGGDVILNVGRYVGKVISGEMVTAMDISAWDYFTKQTVTLPLEPGQSRPTKLYYGLFSGNYEQHYGPNDIPTAGIATMGGGDLFVRTGADFLAQAGTFGNGNLTIYSGGDIMGRFLNMNGQGKLHAAGNFGAYDPTSTNARVQIELFNSKFYVTASGEIQIAAVLNPSLASDKIHYKMEDDFVNCTYTKDTSISLKAGTDVTIGGKSTIYNNTTYSIAETVLPATVNIEAGEDISLLNYFTLTSSPTGHLRLVAGGDIRGSDPITGADQAHMIMMSDIAPEYWYGLFQIYHTAEAGRTWVSTRTVNDTLVNNKHGFYKDPDKQATARPLHAVSEDDSEDIKALKNRPIEIRAGKDIKNLKMYFPKKAEVTAQGDITDINYEGQNIHPEDVSKIEAGGNISMRYARADTSSVTIDQVEGLVQGGPGVFFVQAGDSIDLGTLRDGIQTIGNGRYSKLGTEKSSLIIVSGYRFVRTADDIGAFFETIQQTGDDYARLSAEGKLGDASRLLKETRDETISPFLGEPSGEGDINMTASQIGTSIGQSDVFIIASRDLNLGKTALPVSGTISKTTGITTGGGGAINIFSGRDVNVNESRVMTFYGGDITVWSDQGNINAGRGSRTAVSASPPKVLDDGTRVFSPPAIGSGLRAVTYGENAPEPGNIHLFAPTGIIDAGEAEISGGKVTVAATQVLNVQNISFSAGSVGVPAASTGQAVGGLAGLSGSIGGLTETTKMVEQTAALAPARAEAAKAVDEFITRWVDVEILGFE